MAVAREKNFVSCIVYLHNDSNRVRDFMSKVCGIIQENFEKYEIICVNDGCVDDTLVQARDQPELLSGCGGGDERRQGSGGGRFYL